jgi:catechol 2,3-dioxygenase-like lactoylglutathione lyase family enzyme
MRITSATLGTARPAAMRAFYAGSLGLPVADTPDGGFTVTAGWSRLTFAPAPAGTAPVHHFAFQIPENGVDAAMGWLDGRADLLPHQGSAVVAFPNWDAHAIYFLDPDGHIVEFIAHHGLPTASDAPFGPASLLGLAEVGLPGEVRPLAAAIEAGIGEGVWSGGGPGFAAVGDAWSRFILVPEGHHWLPTTIPAGVFPTAVTVEAARRGAVGVGKYAIAAR